MWSSSRVCPPLTARYVFLLVCFFVSFPRPSTEMVTKGTFYSILNSFEGYDYTFISSQTSWQEASNLCKALYQAKLASIDSQSALNFLVKWLAASFIETAWLGGYKNPNVTLEDPETEFFLWQDKKDRVQSFVWAVGFPMKKPTMADFLTETNWILTDDPRYMLLDTAIAGARNSPGNQLFGAICKSVSPPVTTTTTTKSKDDDDD